MLRVVLTLLAWICTDLAWASASGDGSTFNFSPPPGDYSVVFLGNIFGIVDGVLHGTGSQIMGSMFSVFNSAVLAIGGIIITYTLLVSTMNTAHKGQMLGEKWSSVWVPLRSTIGLALLIPKTSGYCVMQIFVMWIVIQGIGAADRVWQAALSYLNRGGVIVQPQSSTSSQLISAGTKDAMAEISAGAQVILSGQVCMIGLQTILEQQRQLYLKSAGTCDGSTYLQDFCKTPVPDFLNSVNAVTIQDDKPSLYIFSAEMPTDSLAAPYSNLHGICGSIVWNQLNLNKPSSNLSSTSTTDTNAYNSPCYSSDQGAPTFASKISGIGLTSDECNTTQMSRAIAIQQMYSDLGDVAQIMINNDPVLDNSNSQTDTGYPQAIQQYGVPLMADGQTVCLPMSGPNCVNWGADPTSTTNTSAPLFSGTEFQGALADYNGIMLPTINLLNQMQDAKKNEKARQFIRDANNNGWLLAGSYFFDLANLNALGQNSNLVDVNSGLKSSSIDLSSITSAFDSSTSTCKYANGSSPATPQEYLCTYMRNDPSKVNALINNLITGGLSSGKLGQPNTAMQPSVTGSASSTVYGFVSNSLKVQLPGQPGQTAPSFGISLDLSVDVSKFKLPEQHFSCGGILKVCVGRFLGNLFYNSILRYVLSALFNVVPEIINMVVQGVLVVPLISIASIFQEGVSMIQNPTTNPVIALAQMGVYYINFASNLWITTLSLAVIASLFPIGNMMFALTIFVFPLLIAWLGIMLSIGILTAFWVPSLPYIIFTFGSIAWLIVVIEAMVAAPLVALGITNPEGHEAFGKGEHAVMILFNVFLRPAMMIIGYITAIALIYVLVWIINAGFAHAMASFEGGSSGLTSSSTGYTGWAGIYAFFVAVLIYTSMYMIVVQKAFTLITILPDRVLRWIGSQAESMGQETGQWQDEAKSKIGDTGEKTHRASMQMQAKMQGNVIEGAQAAKNAFKKRGVEFETPNSEANSDQDQGGGGGGGGGNN